MPSLFKIDVFWQLQYKYPDQAKREVLNAMQQFTDLRPALNTHGKNVIITAVCTKTLCLLFFFSLDQSIMSILLHHLRLLLHGFRMSQCTCHLHKWVLAIRTLRVHSTTDEKHVVNICPVTKFNNGFSEAL